MSEFRILDHNYFFDSGVTITASSSATDFPVSNLTSHLRSKTWRSAGNFVVTTTNWSLDFNDGTGNVSGNLTPGTYTVSQLETEIVETLDVAGPANHTASFNETTGLWTITGDGSSFSLLWNTGSNTATGAHGLLGFDSGSDDTGSLTYTGSNIALHTEEWVKIDLSTTEAIDSFALLFDKVDGPLLSDSAVVKIQAHATDSWASPSVNVTVTLDEDYDVYTYRWASSQSYRYWRVLIVDPANANLNVELGTVVLSLATQLSQMPSIGFETSLRDLSKKQENDYGNQFFDVYPSRRELVFNHTALPETDIQTLYEIYDRVGSVTPVCVWMDPAATIYDKDRFFLYGRLKGEFKATHNFYTFFDQELSIVEAI